jgi:leucyl aminopeptidase
MKTNDVFKIDLSKQSFNGAKTNHKFKFQQNIFDITNNSTKKADAVTFVFTFNTVFLPNAKRHLAGGKLTKFDDLDMPGAHASLSNSTVLAISLGKKDEFNLTNYLKTLKSIATILRNNKKITSLSLVLEDTLTKLLGKSISEYVESSIFHILNHLYHFDTLKTSKTPLAITHINFITTTPQTQAIDTAIALTQGVFLVKDLANYPANIATPSFLAKAAKDCTKISKKVKVEILHEKEIKKLKMGAFLAIAQGSAESAKFIKIEYTGGTSTQKPLVLIGKGVTFDSGGISIKPAVNMDTMKFDMCGAATVIGLLHVVAKLKLPLNIVGLIPACENLPSGNAIKPGDVITTMAGTTVEIKNTDAEGRLILCDALTYAKKYNPELVIDIATLTGACIMALGGITSAMYSNDDKLAKGLLNSASRTEDKTWQMPLFDEYADMLSSNVADLSNIGSSRGIAGSVVAACFLKKFTDYKWAHLDIAGTATGDSLFGANNNGGATGRPFYLLIDFLRNYSNL